MIKSFINDNIISKNTTAFKDAGVLNVPAVPFIAETLLDVEKTNMDMAK